MAQIKTIGFPRMHKEKSEKRDFLPKLMKDLRGFKDYTILLEKNYGVDMGYSEEDYLNMNSNLKFVEHEEVYKADIVVVLRAPEEYEINYMRPGAILFSMLHYETRELRNKLLKEKGIICYSMDSLVDDDDMRMLVNYRGTSSSAIRIGFEELKKRMPNFYSENREPINATIIGLGSVAQGAAKALEEVSDKEFLDKNPKVPGVIIRMLPRTITKDVNQLKKILKDTDMLIDASRRSDPSEIIIPNSLIGVLPNHAIIVDITADPYNENIFPTQVKGIEGIPTGTLEKYIIEPDDEIYETIPKVINSKHRRVVVSCNAWPGVDPKSCMQIYGNQILPFLKVLLSKQGQDLSIESDDLYERALAKASLDYYLERNREN